MRSGAGQAVNKSSITGQRAGDYLKGADEMKVWEFEQAVYDREEVRIVVRAPIRTVLGSYSYARAASGTTSVSQWLQQRISHALNGHEVVVLDGNGAIPHGRTSMATLRSSYER
jgi:hypothetical protein